MHTQVPVILACRHLTDDGRVKCMKQVLLACLASTVVLLFKKQVPKIVAAGQTLFGTVTSYMLVLQKQIAIDIEFSNIQQELALQV